MTETELKKHLDAVPILNRCSAVGRGEGFFDRDETYAARFAELVPGADLVPFWTLAVANVYRKSKQTVVITEETREQRPALKG